MSHPVYISFITKNFVLVGYCRRTSLDQPLRTRLRLRLSGRKWFFVLERSNIHSHEVVFNGILRGPFHHLIVQVRPVSSLSKEKLLIIHFMNLFITFLITLHCTRQSRESKVSTVSFKTDFKIPWRIKSLLYDR